mmetsp:Transcript_72468/g.203466  ORF Transcript_72468/g.203466 Transcript_72468/m.203466 type:complete len:240 (+) Transcript_72468:585-1304(+)
MASHARRPRTAPRTAAARRSRRPASAAGSGNRRRRPPGRRGRVPGSEASRTLALCPPRPPASPSRKSFAEASSTGSRGPGAPAPAASSARRAASPRWTAASTLGASRRLRARRGSSRPGSLARPTGSCPPWRRLPYSWSPATNSRPPCGTRQPSVSWATSPGCPRSTPPASRPACTPSRGTASPRCRRRSGSPSATAGTSPGWWLGRCCRSRRGASRSRGWQRRRSSLAPWSRRPSPGR